MVERESGRAGRSEGRTRTGSRGAAADGAGQRLPGGGHAFAGDVRRGRQRAHDPRTHERLPDPGGAARRGGGPSRARGVAETRRRGPCGRRRPGYAPTRPGSGWRGSPGRRAPAPHSTGRSGRKVRDRHGTVQDVDHRAAVESEDAVARQQAGDAGGGSRGDVPHDHSPAHGVGPPLESLQTSDLEGREQAEVRHVHDAQPEHPPGSHGGARSGPRTGGDAARGRATPDMRGLCRAF